MSNMVLRDASASKKDIKRPFFPPCRNWPIYDEKGTFFTWLAHKQSQVGAVQQEVRSSRALAPSTMSLSWTENCARRPGEENKTWKQREEGVA